MELSQRIEGSWCLLVKLHAGALVLVKDRCPCVCVAKVSVSKADRRLQEKIGVRDVAARHTDVLYLLVYLLSPDQHTCLDLLSADATFLSMPLTLATRTDLLVHDLSIGVFPLSLLSSFPFYSHSLRAVSGCESFWSSRVPLCYKSYRSLL